MRGLDATFEDLQFLSVLLRSEVLEQAAPRESRLALRFNVGEREAPIPVIGVGKRLVGLGIGNPHALLRIGFECIHSGNAAFHGVSLRLKGPPRKVPGVETGSRALEVET